MLTERTPEEKAERKERLRLEKEERMKRYVESFRKQAGFTLTEELTEDKIKYKDYIIKHIAVLNSVPSAQLREEILQNKSYDEVKQYLKEKYSKEE